MNDYVFAGAMAVIAGLLCLWKLYREERKENLERVRKTVACSLEIVDKMHEAGVSLCDKLTAAQEENEILKRDMEIKTDNSIALRKELTAVKRELAARKGADTKRAKAIGKCKILGGPVIYCAWYQGGFISPHAQTPLEAKEACERLLGLKGKLEWEEVKRHGKPPLGFGGKVSGRIEK